MTIEYEMNLKYDEFLKGARRVDESFDSFVKRARSADDHFARLYNSNVQLSWGMTKTASEVGKATKQFKMMEGGLSNVSYQIQDMAVQAQMGTDSLIILGQQGPQIASVFGPGGAAVGSLIAIGALIGGVLASSVDAASESIDEMIERIDELGRAERALLSIKLQDEMSSIAMGSAEAEAKVFVLTNNIKELEKNIANVQSGTAEGWLTDVLFNTDDAKKEIAELNEELIIAKATVEKGGAAYEKYAQTLKDLKLNVDGTSKAIKDAQKAYAETSQSLAVQIEMLGKTEREQAKLAARYQVGADATESQVQAINALIDAYFNEKQILDAKIESERISSAESEKTEKLLTALSNAYDVASKRSSGYARDAAILAQVQKLGAEATREQVSEVEKLAGLLFDIEAKEKDSKKSKKDDSSVDKFISDLEMQNATELELIDIQYEAKLEKLAQFQDAELISKQEAANAAFLIEANKAKQLEELEKKSAATRKQAQGQFFSDLISLTNGNSRKMFEIGKIAAIANATIKGGEAATSAFAAGMSVGGPYAPAVAAAYTAASIAATASQISSIASTSYGGGSGGATTPPTAPTIPELSQTQQSVNINISGLDNDYGKMVIDQINEQLSQGASLNI